MVVGIILFLIVRRRWAKDNSIASHKHTGGFTMITIECLKYLQLPMQ